MVALRISQTTPDTTKVNTPTMDRNELCHKVASAFVEYNSDCAPDTCKQVNRDCANNVIDLQLVEERNREDYDHTTDATDQCRHAKGRRQGVQQ